MMARPASGAPRGSGRAASPTGVRRSEGAGNAWHEVLELCKKGFATKLEGLCEGLVQAVRAEMKQGTERWRGELLDQMSQREHALDRSLMALHEKFDQLDRMDLLKEEMAAPPHATQVLPEEPPQIQRVATDSLKRSSMLLESPVMEHLRQSETMRQASSAQLEQLLDGLRERCDILDRQNASVLNGVRRLEQQVGQLEHKAQMAEAKIGNVMGQQQSLSATSSNVAKELQALQQKDALAFSELQTRLQSHAQEIRSVVHDDVHYIKEDLGSIKDQEHHDFRTVVTEISRIQQVLHLDFVKVLHEEPCRKMIARARQAPKQGDEGQRRFRDDFAQTEPPPRKEGHCQTEASLYLDLERPRNRKSSERSKPATVEDAKTQHLGGGGEEHFREKAREAALKPPYSVFDFYHERGCAQAIAKNAYFEYVTLVVVFLNACWMAIDMDLNTASIITSAHPVFLITENVFCSYFFLELSVRFFAFKRKCNCLRDPWFVLDLILMLLYVLDTWLVIILVYAGGIEMSSGTSMMTILRLLRMAKLCRLTRLAKLLRAVPELIIIVKGIGFASRSVTIFFIFWTLIAYAFAIAIRQLTDKSEVGDLYFKTVPETMNILLLQGLFPESMDLLAAISGGENWYLWPLTVFFLAIASLTVMYMLVGVLVEVVQVVASVEKESLAVTFLASELRRVLQKMGFPLDEPISKSQFQRLVVEPRVARIIHSVGVDVATLCDMLDLIFEEVEREGMMGMDFGSLIENILSLRGSNPARVKDCVEVLKMFKIMLFERHEQLLKKMRDEFHKLKTNLEDVKEDVKELRDAEVREKQMRLQRPPGSDSD